VSAVRRTAALAVIAVALLVAGGPAGAGEAPAAPIPEPGRSEVAGAYWKRFGLIAVSSGFVPSAQGALSSSADLLLYDVASNQWQRGPDLPGPRDHASMAAVGGSLYLVGGYTAGLSGATKRVFRLDSPDGEWQEVASMDTPRGALAAVALQGQLVALGGANDDGVLASTEIYDPGTDEWSPGPSLEIEREHFGATAVGRRVYAVGGRNPQNLTSVESLAFRHGEPRGEWTQEAEAELEFSRGGNGAATAGGVACTAGGEEQAGTIGPVECLVDGEWRHVSDMAEPRHGLAVVGVGGDLHIIAGGPEPGLAFSTDHEVFAVPGLV
jgi:hypothetical protein